MRFLVLGLVATLLSGCASDVAMENPRTKEAYTCSGSRWGLDPWSQYEACIADREAQGWMIAEPADRASAPRD